MAKESIQKKELRNVYKRKNKTKSKKVYKKTTKKSIKKEIKIKGNTFYFYASLMN